MILSILRYALSLLLPVLAGWLFIPRVWTGAKGILRLAVGAVIGVGYSGAAYFMVLCILGNSKWSIVASEGLQFAAIVLMLLVRRPAAPVPHSSLRSRSLLVWPFLVSALLTLTTFFFVLDWEALGGFDSTAMWNMKARFIYLSASPFSQLFDFCSAHPDYPLLLPSIISRTWQYAGFDSTQGPQFVASFFTVAAAAVTVSCLRHLTTAAQTWVAGCILLGTPFLLGLGALQYADIVMACFISASVLLLCIHDTTLQRRFGLPLLAGAAASFAACTKNEGIMFFVVLVSVRIVLGLLRRTFADSGRELLSFAAGASTGLAALFFFKFLHSPPNEIVHSAALTTMLEHILNPNLHIIILKGFRDNHRFGEWTINPMPWMAAHMVVSWIREPRFGTERTWWTPALVLAGMLGGYYMVYLLSPYEPNDYIHGSFSRLLLQLWPMAVAGYAMIVAPLHDGSTESKTPAAIFQYTGEHGQQSQF